MYIVSLLILVIATSMNVGAHGFSRDIIAYSSNDSSITALRNITSSSTNSSHGSFWLEQIRHQGGAAFNKDQSYQIFRNVKHFGAKGDGVSDDTAALNLAVSSGDRCRPGNCDQFTTTPALVYIPAGTYLVSGPIIDSYFTQIVGNPNNLPILKATKNFTGFAVIDGNLYQPGSAAHSAGFLAYNATNVFYRQIRNLVVDSTDVSASVSIKAIHWPTAQATSLKNLIIRMNDQAGTQHQGLFIESGSGGFMSDISFYGGLTGALMGNRQFASRNLHFFNAIEAIEHLYDWGWTYKSIHISNCSVGLNLTNFNPAIQNVGSVTIIDSSFTNTPIGIATSHDSSHWAVSNGSLILESIDFRNVQLAVVGTKNWTALPTNSGNLHVQAWGIGHEYAPDGPQDFLGTLPAVSRATSLVRENKNGTYYERSKPQYNEVPVTGFVSVQSQGAKGDGVTDDTEALQSLLDEAGASGDHVIVFFDAGTYKVTKTLHFPKICKIVGESYATIISSGSFFADMNNPQPVVQVGKPGDIGSVEWSDMIVSTQGAQAGAILIEWNVATVGQPSGMWDVHTRIGGFTGSNLGLAECAAKSDGPAITMASAGMNHSSTAELKPRDTPGFSRGLAGIETSANIERTQTTVLTNLAEVGLPFPVAADGSQSATSTGVAIIELPNATSITTSQPASSALSPASPSNPPPQIQISPLALNSSFVNTTRDNSSKLNEACIGAFMSMHISKSASGLYMENVWLWTADHDLDASLNNITVYSGRGLLVESEKGDLWMVATSSEHHSLYQYQLAHTQNVFLSQMQSETAYYQPRPRGGTPFPFVESLNDPQASDFCQNGNGYGLRILESQHVAIYGAGLYAFYNNYDDSCSFPSKQDCQRSIFSIEGSSTTDITIYNLNTVGAPSMVDRDGTSLAKYSDNVDVFPDTVAFLRIG